MPTRHALTVRAEHKKGSGAADEGGRPAGRQALHEHELRRLASLEEREAALADEAKTLRQKLEGKTAEERAAIKDELKELKEQQDRVERQLKELRAELKALGALALLDTLCCAPCR